MAIENVLSMNPTESKRLLVALVGKGPALDALVNIMGKSDFVTAFPKVKIAGWAPAPGDMADLDELEMPLELSRQPLYPDIPSLFAARPGVALAIDLSPDGIYMESLRALAPAGVSIGTADLLLRFCAAADDGRLAIGGGESLRKAEKLFALLVDQMDEDILILDDKGKVIDANRHAAVSRGLMPGALPGQSCSELDGDGKRFCTGAEASCPFKESVATGKQAQKTFAQTLENGRVRYIHALCFPVTDALGGPARYLYIRRDVTEQRQLEQRLQQTEKMAAIGELSTYMAHEIRNPLFSIGGFANALLRNPSLNDLAKEKARIIYDESRRLDNILTSILNFARPTEQTMGVFDAAAVAGQTLDLMTLGSEERGLSVIRKIDSNLPRVRGNAENLKQCLINLVKNAMEAMPDGGALTLGARKAEGFVELFVADTGPGIAPHLQDQIFSPFFTTKHGGAGLGLAMTRKVIEEMGGRVELESRQESGTRVSLTLPVALAVDDAGHDALGQEQSKTAPGLGEPILSTMAIAGKNGATGIRSRKGPDEEPYA